MAEIGFHAKWYNGSNAERTGFSTSGIFEPFFWYENDTGDLYYWDGSTWQPWGGSGVAQGAGTLTVSTSNSTADPHTHAITTSANPGAAASILASDASGHLQLVRAGLSIAPAAGQTLYIQPPAATDIGIAIKAHASQSAYLQQYNFAAHGPYVSMNWEF